MNIQKVIDKFEKELGNVSAAGYNPLLNKISMLEKLQTEQKKRLKALSKVYSPSLAAVIITDFGLDND